MIYFLASHKGTQDLRLRKIEEEKTTGRIYFISLILAESGMEAEIGM